MTNLATRISLRNDVLSNWTSSTIVLNKGEVALARLDGDKYEMRVGVGDKTWSQLSGGGIVIPAENVTGLTETISQLSTSYYETTDIGELTGTYVNGDIAVEKKDIDGTHQQYTAYRWSLVDGTYKWAALDGNYSAENVYFPKNMTMTYTFGKYTVPSSGSYELSCKGKSVADMINDAFAKTQSGTKSNPTFTYTLGSYTASKEVGETYTIPAATLKMTSVGSYQYGPATGITVPANSATVKSPEFAEKKNSAAMTATNGSNTLATSAGMTQHSYTDTAAKYTYTATASYTEGAVPKNNVGGDDPGNKIPAGTFTKSETATFTGYRKGFYGYRLASESRLDFNNMTSNDIRNNIHATVWNATTGAWPTSFTVPANSTQIIFAVPAKAEDYSSHKYIKMSNIALGTYYFDNNGLLRTPANNLSVDGAASGTGMAYHIWTINPDGAFNADTVYTITYGSTKQQ